MHSGWLLQNYGTINCCLLNLAVHAMFLNKDSKVIDLPKFSPSFYPATCEYSLHLGLAAVFRQIRCRKYLLLYCIVLYCNMHNCTLMSTSGKLSLDSSSWLSSSLNSLASVKIWPNDNIAKKTHRWTPNGTSRYRYICHINLWSCLRC